MPSLEDPKTFLQSLDPYSIDFIEILTGPLTAIYGVDGAGGVILINTVRNSKDIAQVNSQGLTILYPKGYANPADFPLPAASDKKDAKRPPASASSPDQRSTLCWSANLLTDANGNARLNFFTPREQSTYLATVIGITENGDLISKKLQIKCQ
jgi:outer membrane receptor protein involved in Fe transport